MATGRPSLMVNGPESSNDTGAQQDTILDWSKSSAIWLPFPMDLLWFESWVYDLLIKGRRVQNCSNPTEVIRGLNQEKH